MKQAAFSARRSPTEPAALRRAAALAVAVALLSAGVAKSAELVCPGKQGISVQSADAALAHRACAAAEAGLQQLAACGLTLDGTFSIEVVRDFGPLAVPCLGYFDCAANTVRVLEPPALGLAAGPAGPFAEVPVDLLFDSVVAHEVAHVVLTEKAPDLSVAAQEYAGFVMQLATMPEDERAKLLARHETVSPVPESSLNELILAMAPGVFAAKAWAHFSSPGNGCSFLSDLVAGNTNLGIFNPGPR